MRNHIALTHALEHLSKTGNEFDELFTHGTLVVEHYKPHGRDKQQPHLRDEIYVIAQGESDFVMNGQQTFCKAGDVLFVPAGAMHRFIDFTENFSTWVFFYGPKGGENEKSE